MPLPPRWSPRTCAAACATVLVVVAFMYLHPTAAHAALARAAGKESTAQGGSKGDAGGGFTELFDFLNTLTTYLMYLGGAFGALGFIKAGVEYQAGSPSASRTAGGTVIGIVLVLLAKGITL